MSNPKVLMSGNEAIAQAAIDAGCRFYAGYPITPQNEFTAYMAYHIPEAGGVFIQSESELAAISMVFGASASGVRAMTSSSSPGISLMQEGISYLAGAELPCVIANIMRAGPGLGNIWPAQSDYFQATKGGGHGDYRCLVLAPSTMQESFDLTILAFDLADKYRIPAIILSDGMLGQMMEPLVAYRKSHSAYRNDKSDKQKPWALTGCRGRRPNLIRTLRMKFGDLEEHNLKLQEKYKKILPQEQRQESFYLDDADVVLVAYGTMSRLSKQAMLVLRQGGLKVGLIRPISLWPFPKAVFTALGVSNAKYLVVEMSYGQMIEDVQLSLDVKTKVEFLGRSGGGIPSVEEIINRVKGLAH